MNEWIDVKDRLPELLTENGGIQWSKKVLCHLIDKNMVIASKLNVRFWKDWENGLTIANESVTHWMPLPEPPE